MSGSGDGTLRVRDVASAVTIEAHAGGVESCAFSPDGIQVVSVSEDGTLRVWDVATSLAVSVIGLGGAALCTNWRDDLIAVGVGNHLFRFRHDWSPRSSALERLVGKTSSRKVSAFFPSTTSGGRAEKGVESALDANGQSKPRPTTGKASHNGPTGSLQTLRGITGRIK
jgi:WD40 repeat protein